VSWITPVIVEMRANAAWRIPMLRMQKVISLSLSRQFL
jgi:hypothetical protein